MKPIRDNVLKRSVVMFTVLSLTGLIGAVDETDSQEPLRFILLTPFANYQFFDPVKKGMADAALSLGVEAIFGGTPDGDMEALAEEVRQASRAGFDGIALNIFDAAALKEAVASATDGDVPVIAFNVDDQRTETARMAAIGQNVRQAGQVIERYFPDRGYFCAGFDPSPEILRLVKAGVIRLTVDQQQGYYAVVGLTLYRRYGLKPSNIDTGAAIITADMVDELIDLTRQHYR